MSSPAPQQRFEWFRDTLVPQWLGRVRDARSGGIFERLDATGAPYRDDPRSTLVHARTLFTLSHLVLAGADHPSYREAVEDVSAFLETRLRHPDGGYFRAVARDGAPWRPGSNRLRDCYDHAFVLLAYSSCGRAGGLPDAEARIEKVWATIEDLFGDSETGGFFEDDLIRQGTITVPRRQNPHMHLLEAVLFAYEATAAARWMERADRILDLFRTSFFDRKTGTLREFLGPKLEPLVSPDGRRREPGHHFEWVWLLHRYAALGGSMDLARESAALFNFAVRHGLCDEGPMRGAVVDVLRDDGRIVEPTMLLWPQTEGVKAYVARFEAHADGRDAAAARALLQLIFGRYLRAAGGTWCNQLAPDGAVTASDAPSRLLYHLAICMTESTRIEPR